MRDFWEWLRARRPRTLVRRRSDGRLFTAYADLEDPRAAAYWFSWSFAAVRHVAGKRYIVDRCDRWYTDDPLDFEVLWVK